MVIFEFESTNNIQQYFSKYLSSNGKPKYYAERKNAQKKNSYQAKQIKIFFKKKGYRNKLPEKYLSECVW